MFFGFQPATALLMSLSFIPSSLGKSQMKCDVIAQRIAVFIASVVMIVTAFAVSRTPHQFFHTPGYLWVEAVLHSFPAENAHPTLATKFYAQAILQSPSPANIYVAWGDFLRGPMPILQEFERLTSDEKMLVQMAATPKAIEPHIEKIVGIIKGDDQCVAAYTAATSADPTNALAQFRLAVYADQEAGLQAARWLTLHDPRNALGPYLEAARSLETNPESILALVQVGNNRSTLQFYADPIPLPAGNRYPEIFDEVAGQMVPYTAIELLVSRQNTWFEFADPLRQNFESLLEALLSIANDNSDPRSKSAAVAHHTFCHKLVFNSSAKLQYSFPGLFGDGKSFDLISVISALNSAELSKAAAEHKQIDRFGELLKSTWRTRHDAIREITVESVFAGLANPILLEFKLVREIQAAAVK